MPTGSGSGLLRQKTQRPLYSAACNIPSRNWRVLARARATTSGSATGALPPGTNAGGKTVEIVGLNEHSAHMHGTLPGELAGSR